MGDYPSALHTWDNVTDEEDIISGAHMNGAHAEIIAIEQEQIDFRSRFSAYLSSGWQSITTGAWRKIGFDAEVFDEKGEYDHVTGFDYTADKSGFYLFGAHITWNSWTAGNFATLAFFLDGNPEKEFSIIHTGAGGEGQGNSALIYVPASSVVDVRLYVSLPAGKNIINGSTKTFFWGHRIS